ncbi:hypothetical protein [Kistimonas asteriae]|uniref:hypothetical protein n=1 Tax=Kistimonas asteriae TaxID=517724 RepID=UPI001BA770DB|nr:hypothetical protein [Kistimonas asteriae]
MERTILNIPVYRPRHSAEATRYSPYPTISALLKGSPSSDPNNSPFVRDIDVSIAVYQRQVVTTPIAASSSSIPRQHKTKQNTEASAAEPTDLTPTSGAISEGTIQNQREFKVIKTNEFNLPYQCSHCSLKAPTIGLLRPHSLTHIPDGTLLCTLCNVTIRDYMEFKKHNRNNHNTSSLTTIPDRKHASEAAECTTCSKWIAEAPNLQVMICFHKMPVTYLNKQ